VKTLLQAIAMQEGFYAGYHFRPHRNSNPGDLEFNSESVRFGATHGDPWFAVFPDACTGWKALQRWLSVPAKLAEDGRLVHGYLGATLQQVVERFAPASENDVDAYLTAICEQTGLEHNTIITQELLDTPETSQ
jgi:hypothetical protein